MKQQNSKAIVVSLNVKFETGALGGSLRSREVGLPLWRDCKRHVAAKVNEIGGGICFALGQDLAFLRDRVGWRYRHS
jgi:hypothetical protein